MFMNKCLLCLLIINEVFVLIKLFIFVLKGIFNIKRIVYSVVVNRVFRFFLEKYWGNVLVRLLDIVLKVLNLIRK